MQKFLNLSNGISLILFSSSGEILSKQALADPEKNLCSGGERAGGEYLDNRNGACQNGEVIKDARSKGRRSLRTKKHCRIER